MELTIENIKKELDKHNYFATDEIVYKMYLGLKFFLKNEKPTGQDMYALLIDGPPGSGKTSYAEVYAKLVERFTNTSVVFDSYQCDPTTGKTELYEDISMKDVVSNNANNVIIDGVIAKAIKDANNNRKVILFIDEYDKAREETDAFLLQFLQSGKLNTTQNGNMRVRQEYKNNIQVILCKNDFRETLSGPLMRRLNVLTLDSMLPSIFNKVANRIMIENSKNPVLKGMVDIVSLIYEEAYMDRGCYNRLPACSELLRAIEDADTLVKDIHPTKYMLAKLLVESIFKNKDDMATFIQRSQKSKNKYIQEIMKDLSESSEAASSETIAELIAEKVLGDKRRAFEAKENALHAREMVVDDMIKKLIQGENLDEEDKSKLKELTGDCSEEDKRELGEKVTENSALTKDEKQQLLEAMGYRFVVNNDKIYALYPHDNDYLRRGEKVFINDKAWHEIGTMSLKINVKKVIDNFTEMARSGRCYKYEDAFLFKSRDDGDFELAFSIVSSEKSPKNIAFYSNAYVTPAGLIVKMVDIIGQIMKDATAVETDESWININALTFKNTEENQEVTPYHNSVYNLGGFRPFIESVRKDAKQLRGFQDEKIIKEKFGVFASNKEEQKFIYIIQNEEE